MAKFLKLIKNSKGATAIEYGLIAALIAVAAIAAMTEHRHQAGHDVQQRFELALSSFSEQRKAAVPEGAAAFSCAALVSAAAGWGAGWSGATAAIERSARPSSW